MNFKEIFVGIYCISVINPTVLAEEIKKTPWKISETSKLTEDLTYETGQEQKEWKSVTALTAKVNSTLAMKVSHKVKNLDKVPAGSENYDREKAVTLVFTF